MYFYQKYLETLGEKHYRIKQIDQALYKEEVNSFLEITSLPLELIKKLDTNLPFSPLKLVEKQISKDLTEKALFQTSDKLYLETVLIKHEKNRNTVCVSSQIGCPLKCTFCNTAQMGFKRNLTSDEIVAQVLFFKKELTKNKKSLKNVVFMGMGEPFLNYEAVMQAIEIINDDKKIAIGSSHITISSCGLIKPIQNFMSEK